MEKKPDTFSEPADPDFKKRLVKRGAPALADALLTLARRDKAADDVVRQLVATPKENIRRIKARISGLNRARRLIDWSESNQFARSLGVLLDDMKRVVADPVIGVTLVTEFYNTDNKTFERCDDSDGSIGDAYRLDAKELFVYYARQCDDELWVARQMFDLNVRNDYGARDGIIESASEYLSTSTLRSLVTRIQQHVEDGQGTYEIMRWGLLVESIARQLVDPVLFEKTRLDRQSGLSSVACIDIAEVYMSSGDAKTAHAWLARAPDNNSFNAGRYDSLLLQVNQTLGQKDQSTEIAWRIFRRHRSANALDDLLSVIGESEREGVLADEFAVIEKTSELSTADANFLVSVGLVDKAEAYIMQRVDQLEGDFYWSLLPLADAFEKSDHLLGATAVLRSLLDSILRRAQTRTYRHGVRYLNKLDNLAPRVTHWDTLQAHEAYFQSLRDNHGRKRSFWSLYNSET